MWADAAAVEKNGSQLKYASERLRDKKEIVLAAVKNKPNALRYAGTVQRSNKEVVVAACKQNGCVVFYVPIWKFFWNPGLFIASILHGGFWTIMAFVGVFLWTLAFGSIIVLLLVLLYDGLFNYKSIIF